MENSVEELVTINLGDFVVTPGNPGPGGGVVHRVRAPDGTVIRTAAWTAPRDGLGTIFVMPGKGEFIEKYFEVIRELRRRGFCVVALDWRGQGLSDRQTNHPTKAYIDDFDDFLGDFEAVFSYYRKKLPGPRFALAHSMGGNILLRLAGERRIPFSAIAMSAPMTGLGIGAKLRRFVEGTAVAMVTCGGGEGFVPGFSETDPLADLFEDNKWTSDRARYDRTLAIIRQNPALAQCGMTWGWLNEAIKSIAIVGNPDFASQIDIPTLIVGAGDDGLVDPETNRYLGDNIPGAEFFLIEGARHEILMEREELRNEFWQHFDAFMARVFGQAA